MNYNLNTRPYRLLCEALRRHTRFNLRSDLKKPLNEAWTGLGTYTDYKPAIVADLMTYVHRPNPRCVQWWKLTDRGAAIVQQWLDQGYTFQDIEAGNYPPRRSPQAQPTARTLREGLKW